MGVTLLAAGALLALSELALRVFWLPHFTQLYRLDDELLYATVGGASHYFEHDARNGGGRVLVSLDADGFRAAELAQPDSSLRVAVLGDSCVMAEFSPERETFVWRLGRELGQRTGRAVRTINAGAVGYGPDQEFLRMRGILERGKLDLLVVVLFADNDLGDLVRNKLFRLDDAGRLVRCEPVLTPELERRFRTGLGASVTYRAIKKAARRLRRSTSVEAGGFAEFGCGELPCVCAARGLARCLAEYEQRIDLGDMRVRSFFRDHYDWDVALAPRGPSASHKRALLTALLRRMVALAGEHDTPLLLVTLPSRADLCRDANTCLEALSGERGYDPRNLSLVFEQAADAAGARHLSLFDRFQAADACELYFAPPDSHWNASGQRLAAECVAEEVARLGLLPADRP